MELMTPEQYDAVKTKDPLRNKIIQGDIEAIWYDIWDILFPGVARPSSVYADEWETLFDASQYWTEHAPVLLNQQVLEDRDMNRVDGYEPSWTVLDGHQEFVDRVMQRLRPLANEISQLSAAAVRRHAQRAAALNQGGLAEQDQTSPGATVPSQADRPTVGRTRKRNNGQQPFGNYLPVGSHSQLAGSFGQPSGYPGPDRPLSPPPTASRAPSSGGARSTMHELGRDHAYGGPFAPEEPFHTQMTGIAPLPSGLEGRIAMGDQFLGMGTDGLNAAAPGELPTGEAGRPDTAEFEDFMNVVNHGQAADGYPNQFANQPGPGVFGMYGMF